MHLPNCHPRHRALRLDEPRSSLAISGRSLVQWLIPRGKDLQLRVPAQQHKYAESLAPAVTLASVPFLLVYFPLFRHLMRPLAAETWFPDLSAFGVFGRSRHRALAHLGG